MSLLPKPNIEPPERIVLLADDHLAIAFPYDPDEVREVKRIPGARWDKLARVWRVPMTSLYEVREFASAHAIQIADEVALFDLPAPKNLVFGVRMDEDWIYCSFAYDPVKVRSVKTIPAITWHARTKAWRAPLTSVAEVIRWADTFGEPVDAEIRTLANSVRSRHAAALEASRGVDADLEVPGIPLLPYQRAAAAYAAEHRRCFIADDMGLGKTITSIATLEHIAGLGEQVFPALVVAPPSLLLNWKAEWERWAPQRRVAVVTNRKQFPERIAGRGGSESGADVVILGYSNANFWEKELRGYPSLILDESHYIKTPTAQRTKAVIKVARSVPKSGLVLCLTGTPVTNRPAEYAAQLDALGRLNEFGGRWGFYRRYCGAYRDKWGQWHIDGHSNLDELNDRLRGGGLYIRRTKEQVLDELPPVRHNPLIIEGDAARMREYRKADADIVRYMIEQAKRIAEELGVSPHAAAVRARMRAQSAEHVVRLAVLRRLAALAKIPYVEEWVQQHIDAKRKVVLAAHHRDVVDALAQRFGNCRIQGGMKVSDVEAAKKRFQNDSVEETPVIVLSIQAAKTGHTLTAAQDVAFVEMPFTPADVDQTYSRCHRLGQQGSVTATYLLCSDTIDESVYGLVESKRQVVEMATEGTGMLSGSESVSEALVEEYFARGLEAME